jgi:hypothetical protein
MIHLQVLVGTLWKLVGLLQMLVGTCWKPITYLWKLVGLLERLVGTLQIGSGLL